MSDIEQNETGESDIEASVAEAVAAETGLVQPSRSERARFLRFLVTGGFAAAINVLARWLLGHLMRYELAVALAYLVGMTTAFVLARWFVFDAGKGGVRGQYLRFALVNLVAFAQVWIVSVLLARVVLPAIGWTWQAETIAHVIGVLSPVVTSYVGHKKFSFRPH